MNGYGHARELLDDALMLVFQLVRRQITALGEIGFLSPVSGPSIGGLALDTGALLEGGRSPSPEGAERLAELDRKIVELGDTIETRLEASRAAGRPLVFDTIRRALGLSPTEARALLVVVACEIDQRIRTLMRYLANDPNRGSPDVGFIEQLVYSSPDLREALVREMANDAPLFRYRILEFSSRREPFQLRSLCASPRIIEALHGVMRLDPEVASVARLVRSPPSSSHLIVASDLVEKLERLVGGSRDGARPLVVLAGPSGSGRTSLLQGAARAHLMPVIEVGCAGLPGDPVELASLMQAVAREAIVFGAMLVLEGIDELASDAGSGRRDRAAVVSAAVLSTFPGVLTGTAGRGKGNAVRVGDQMIVFDLDFPTEQQRASLWRRALGNDATDELCSHAAARYAVTGGTISIAAKNALIHAAARGAIVSNVDVHAGLRGVLDDQLSTLGVRITWRQTWDDLVLPEEALEEVVEFIARVRYRRRVYEDWGFGRKVGKGVGLSALFCGPPGTGKTMVAGLIADELALDLYQIDLSRIVSKYVGETEKNLANLFDAAEAGHALLLFDEADSLFAKRTEVKSSVDRYANLEVNYLLQRLEAFNGVTILTTNLDSSIDEAFRRRLSFRLEFPMPEAAERAALWKRMIPGEAAVAADFSPQLLAERFEMSGGYIKNAVVRAAFMAAAEQGPIKMAHLLRAASLEYAAMGKVMHAR